MNNNHYVTHSNMHSDTRTFKCGNCSKAFFTKSGLTQHLKGCQVMTKTFSTQFVGNILKPKRHWGSTLHLFTGNKFEHFRSEKVLESMNY